MPSFGATGIPPDMNLHMGRGWEPDRTYHTPRAEASGRSSKSGSGRVTRAAEAAAAPDPTQFRLSRRRTTGWESEPAPMDAVHRSQPVQPGLDTVSNRTLYQQHRPILPGPPCLGEGLSHAGFEPRRGPYGGEAGWDRHYSTKKEPPEGPKPPRDSSWPALMGGKVLAGGKLPPTPAHHVPGYESPDRALVGDEERTAMAMALKKINESNTKKQAALW